MSEIANKISNYLDTSISTMELLKNDSQTIEAIYNAIKKCVDNGNRIFLLGNGGSAATASHFVCDLNKTATRKHLKKAKAFALNDNTPSVFAISNDIGFEHVFEEQLITLLDKNDIVIAISGSGNSENIINAVNFAKNLGSIVLGLTGFEGGKLKKLCDICLVIPSDKMYHIEDGHLLINHIITYLFTGYSYE